MNVLLCHFEDSIALTLAEKGAPIRVWIRVGKGKRPKNWKADSVKIIKRQNFLLNDYEIDHAQDIFLPYDLYQQLKRDCFLLFIRCFDRWNQCKSHKLNMIDYEHAFLSYANNIYKILKDFNIDTVISALIPHMGADVILYFLSKILGIKTILAYQNSPVSPDALIFLDRIEDLGIFSHAYANSKHCLSINTQPPNQKPFYAQKHQDRFFLAASELFKASFRYLYTRAFFKSKYGKKASKERVCKAADWMKFMLLHKKEKTQNYINYFNRKYIYIPLHLEPEMTVDILGAQYNNQLEFIAQLRKKIPDDVYLLIKENPMQNSYSRSYHFFEVIKNLNNVVYISEDIDTFSLTQHAIAVATIVGTAGWEALRLRKPVIIGGHAWYQGFPGVWHIDDFKWEDIMDAQIDLNQLKQHAEHISKFHVKGVIVDFDIYAAELDDFNADKNAHLVSYYILDYLNTLQATSHPKEKENEE